MLCFLVFTWLAVVREVFYLVPAAASLILMVPLGLAAQRRSLSRVPCKTCHRKDLEQRNDPNDLQQLLICHQCDIVWRTDISNAPAD